MRNGGRFRRTRCLSRRIVIRYGVLWLTSESNSRRSFMRNHWAMITLLFAGIFICCLPLCAQEKVVWSDRKSRSSSRFAVCGNSMTVCGRAQRNVWLCRFGSCQQPPAGRKVNEAFVVERIPKSFVYDREGKLVAQSIRHAHAQRVSADAGGLWVELVCVGADAFVRPASESERGW